MTRQVKIQYTTDEPTRTDLIGDVSTEEISVIDKGITRNHTERERGSERERERGREGKLEKERYILLDLLSTVYLSP